MKSNKFYDYAYQVIDNQDQPYFTKDSLHKLYKYNDSNYKEINKIFDHVDQEYGKDVKSEVVTCEGLSYLLKTKIHYENHVIRHLMSMTTSNKVQYADLLKIPGTDNYRQVFHYQLKLSPENKHRIRVAQHRVLRYKGTGRLSPDPSNDAPAYMIPNRTKLWAFHMIFKSDLLPRIKGLKEKSIQKSKTGFWHRLFHAKAE